MVTKPSKQTIPPTHQGLELSRKQDPAQIVSGFSYPAVKGKSERDYDEMRREANKGFELPETQTAAETKDQSYRYGGGRSAGNRSIAANKAKKENQP